MSAKRNLLIYLKKKSISKAEFYKNTGVSNGFLDKSDNISSSNLALILNFYEDLSSDWLITGRGDMLKGSPNISPSGSPVTQPVPPPVQTDQSPGTGCKLCIEKDQRIADLQKSIEMWETHFKTLSTNFQSVVQSYMSDKQYLQDQIEILQQQHFDDEEDVTSQAG